MAYWLMKSEPDDVSIDDLAERRTVAWYGVRNFQARNFMKNDMHIGDGVLFYHSSCPQPGIAGLAQVSKLAYPDATQFDATSKYFDPKSTRETPRWHNVDVTIVRKTELLSLERMRALPDLASMIMLRRGNRLSITPVTQAEWQAVSKLLK
jgi:predicted RNA-binding protein with PUA-like domain